MLGAAPLRSAAAEPPAAYWLPIIRSRSVESVTKRASPPWRSRPSPILEAQETDRRMAPTARLSRRAKCATLIDPAARQLRPPQSPRTVPPSTAHGPGADGRSTLHRVSLRSQADRHRRHDRTASRDPPDTYDQLRSSGLRSCRTRPRRLRGFSAGDLRQSRRITFPTMNSLHTSR